MFSSKIAFNILHFESYVIVEHSDLSLCCSIVLSIVQVAVVIVCCTVSYRAMSKLNMCQINRDYYLPAGAIQVPQHR